MLKLMAALAAAWGVYGGLFHPGKLFIGGLSSLLFFTMQSNILVIVVQLIMVCYMLKGKHSKTMGRMQLCTVVSISLTMGVFWTMLAPFNPGIKGLYNQLLHTIAPSLTIIDYLFFDDHYKPDLKDTLYSTLFPLAYVGFTIVCYFLNVEFLPGKNYPYPFLNYGGSAGVFGFSTNTKDSLYLGSFYWIMILLILVVLVANIYRFIHNKMQTKG